MCHTHGINQSAAPGQLKIIIEGRMEILNASWSAYGKSESLQQTDDA